MSIFFYLLTVTKFIIILKKWLHDKSGYFDNHGHQNDTLFFMAIALRHIVYNGNLDDTLNSMGTMGIFWFS